MPGFTLAMYALLSVVELIGRSLGGLVHYSVKLPQNRRFAATFGIYLTYETMDMCLLWLPYPLMLANRALCGFLGINSATIRESAVQTCLPDRLRARVNAFLSMMGLSVAGVLSLAVGALGEMLDYRVCMTLCGAATMAVCWLTVWRRRAGVRRVCEWEPQPTPGLQAE